MTPDKTKGCEEPEVRKATEAEKVLAFIMKYAPLDQVDRGVGYLNEALATARKELARELRKEIAKISIQTWPASNPQEYKESKLTSKGYYQALDSVSDLLDSLTEGQGE